MRHYRRRSKPYREHWRAAFDAYLRRDAERRLSLPPLPPDPAPGEVYRRIIVIERHRTVEIVQTIPACSGRNRPRCEQMTTHTDGTLIGERMGTTALLRHLATDVLIAPMSRKSRREMDDSHP